MHIVHGMAFLFLFSLETWDDINSFFCFNSFYFFFMFCFVVVLHCIWNTHNTDFLFGQKENRSLAYRRRMTLTANCFRFENHAARQGTGGYRTSTNLLFYSKGGYGKKDNARAYSELIHPFSPHICYGVNSHDYYKV